MSYTRLYVNGKFFRLYRGSKRKTFRNGTPQVMRYWEIGVGRFTITIGRWSS